MDQFSISNLLLEKLVHPAKIVKIICVLLRKQQNYNDSYLVSGSYLIPDQIYKSIADARFILPRNLMSENIKVFCVVGVKGKFFFHAMCLSIMHRTFNLAEGIAIWSTPFSLVRIVLVSSCFSRFRQSELVLSS